MGLETTDNGFRRLGKGSYELLSSDKFTSNDKLPKLNKYGQIFSGVDDNELSIVGNRIEGNITNLINDNRCYGHLQFMYLPQTMGVGFPSQSGWQYDPNSDLLLNYLSIKGKLLTSEYFEVFKILNYREFPQGNDIDINILSRLAINYYFASGYITRCGNNYDKILTNPPQLIQLQSDNIINGTKYLLIGARTKLLVNHILQYCKKNKKNFCLFQELTQNNNKKFLFPSNIILLVSEKARDQVRYKVEQFSKECGILYQGEIIYSLGLLSFLPSIDNYFSSLIADPLKQVYKTKIKLFDENKLKFIPANNIPDENNLLIEYQFNAYTYIYKYYENNSSYTVDKNFGIFLTLSRHRKKTIYYYRNKDLIIQASTPLPVFYSRIMFLLSGKLPSNENIKGRWFLKYSNIDGVAADIILEKLNQKGP